MTGQVDELIDRCERAIETLNALADKRTDQLEQSRLRHKASGVRLALSYIREAQR